MFCKVSLTQNRQIRDSNAAANQFDKLISHSYNNMANKSETTEKHYYQIISKT